MKIWGCWVTEKKTRYYDWALKIYELIVLGGIDFFSVYNFTIVFWNCSDGVVFFVLHFIDIYPAMTAFTDQYSLPNIFLDIGQL